MQGRMRMKYKLFFLNALFWIIVFAMKIPFDYYIICQPSVLPVRRGRRGGAPHHTLDAAARPTALLGPGPLPEPAF